MAFQYVNAKGQKYFLHSKDVKLRGSGMMQTIYFFARDVRGGVLDDVPGGYEIKENDRTGLPTLKRT